MSINENPKLESVETLAREAQAYLRDLIIHCQVALAQEPHWEPFPDPDTRRRRPIDRRRDISEWIIPHSESVLRVAINCNDSARLGRLNQLIGGIEREITKEVCTPGSLPSRNEPLKEILMEIADCLREWGKAVTHWAHADGEAARASNPFGLPENIEDYDVRSILELAKKNGYGGKLRQLRQHLAEWEGDGRESGERWLLSRAELEQFLRYLSERQRKKP